MTKLNGYLAGVIVGLAIVNVLMIYQYKVLKKSIDLKYDKYCSYLENFEWR